MKELTHRRCLALPKPAQSIQALPHNLPSQSPCGPRYSRSPETWCRTTGGYQPGSKGGTRAAAQPRAGGAAVVGPAAGTDQAWVVTMRLSGFETAQIQAA